MEKTLGREHAMALRIAAFQKGSRSAARTGLDLRRVAGWDSSLMRRDGWLPLRTDDAIPRLPVRPVRPVACEREEEKDASNRRQGWDRVAWDDGLHSAARRSWNGRHNPHSKWNSNSMNAVVE
ncbi:hypothetical protein CSOJ01_12255 [Colletotrichum sojae]|uniref:Uncharacterized protein n=1 Tax=Colletotrichum sojae TaxID=2175907 RepID=A0A8H6MLU8_9PEZI|nr:hypothetical protein CSOJ01_12255 [Colletotrichum sojae]